jgi:hypothetical protein
LYPSTAINARRKCHAPPAGLLGRVTLGVDAFCPKADQLNQIDTHAEHLTSNAELRMKFHKLAMSPTSTFELPTEEQIRAFLPPDAQRSMLNVLMFGCSVPGSELIAFPSRAMILA